MKRQHSIKYFDEQIKRANKIGIIGHISPDTDAIASMVALKNIIEINYPDKEIDIFADCEKVAERYQSLLFNQKLNDRRQDIYDLAIGVDCPNASRFGIHRTVFDFAKETVQIDHHETNETFADNNINMKASSTCEVVYVLSKALGLNINDSICKVIYAGIITDTANLSQGTMTVRTYKAITEFTERKLDLGAINDYYFKNNSVSKIILLEKAIHSMKFTAGNRVAIMKLTRNDFTEAEATKEDTLGLINHAINIRGIQIAMIIIKQEDNSYYISLRGKEGVNVAEIAKHFGGGGHENMAAFQYDGKITDMKPEFISLCREELAKQEQIKPVENNLFFDTPSLDETGEAEPFDI